MYPTAKERILLHYLNKYHYLTTEALMIATGTKLRAVQSHLTHLVAAEWGTQGAKWYEKIVAYIPFLDEHTNATVVVITPVSEQRVKKLKDWTETVLKKYQREDLGSAFYFAYLQRGMSPEQLFLNCVSALSSLLHPACSSLSRSKPSLPPPGSIA